MLSQIDGAETLSGRFRVRLAETNDASDWKLQAWVERRAEKPKALTGGNSKLVEAYLESGRPREYLEQALRRIEPLSDFERELLASAKVQVEGNERFLEMAKAILKAPRFLSLLAEAKGDVLEGRAAKKNPTARLIFRIMETISRPA